MIHIKLIGLGNRGMRTLERYAYIPTTQARFVELVDLSPQRMTEGLQLLEMQGRPLDHYAHEFWKPDETTNPKSVQTLSYICTDWSSHARLAIEEMEQGHHVAVEVPAAVTLKECELLIAVSRRTGRRCLMMENCCYDSFHLACMEMARKGLFGTITHLEGAYVHNLNHQSAATNEWMMQAIGGSHGNCYPTHAYGPMAQLLALDHDYLDRIVCVDSKLTAGLSTALIRTRKGRSVLLHLDVSTPRPYSRMQTICGTEGFAQKYPIPTLQLRGMDKPVSGHSALQLAERYMTSELAQYWQEGRRKGVPNEMNYAMDRHLLHCIETGERFTAEVEEAAEWSSLIELTARHILQH